MRAGLVARRNFEINEDGGAEMSCRSCRLQSTDGHGVRRIDVAGPRGEDDARRRARSCGPASPRRRGERGEERIRGYWAGLLEAVFAGADREQVGGGVCVLEGA